VAGAIAKKTTHKCHTFVELSLNAITYAACALYEVEKHLFLPTSFYRPLVIQVEQPDEGVCLSEDFSASEDFFFDFALYKCSHYITLHYMDNNFRTKCSLT